MQERGYLLYLEDMLQSMSVIREYINGLDFEAFERNRLIRDGVVRNLEIIGEATRKVPDDVKLQHPEIPWKPIYRLRNIIAHEYFGIDYAVVWRIATDFLPANMVDLENLIKNEREKGKP